jgi:hypothetical protein
MIGFDVEGVQRCYMKADDCMQKSAVPSRRQAAREQHLTSEKQRLSTSSVVLKFIFFFAVYFCVYPHS